MKENNQQEGATADVSGAPKATTLTPEVPETLTQEPVKWLYFLVYFMKSN